MKIDGLFMLVVFIVDNYFIHYYFFKPVATFRQVAEAEAAARHAFGLGKFWWLTLHAAVLRPSPDIKSVTNGCAIVAC